MINARRPLWTAHTLPGISTCSWRCCCSFLAGTSSFPASRTAPCVITRSIFCATSPACSARTGGSAMRPSFPDLMHGLFWLVLAVIVLLVGIHAIAVLDGIEKRQQQGTVHHEKLIALANQSLQDHTIFLAEHQRMLERLGR